MIDTGAMSMAVGILETLPNTAVIQAQAAQAAAEAAAAAAAEHSVGFSYANGVLTLAPITGGNE